MSIMSSKSETSSDDEKARRKGHERLAALSEVDSGVTVHSGEAIADADFRQEVLTGLAKPQKSIPSRFLYDARGSVLFEAITEEPEYYPTRTEIAMLEQNVEELAEAAPADSALIEFGSGSSRKTEILLDEMRDLSLYVPIDISKSALDDAEQRLAQGFPKLEVLPVVGDFGADVDLPSEVSARARLGFFPGSTIGNFTHDGATALLQNFARLLDADGRLIIGVDLKKDADVLIPAYSDKNGVTAAFNLNLLDRINRELSADFDVDAFAHEAVYNAEIGRMESYLVAQAEQSVQVEGETFKMACGERIHTENSYKYTVDEFQGLAADAGWKAEKCWIDPDNLFSLHELSITA